MNTIHDRSFSLFLSAIKSEQTKGVYKYHLARFLKWNDDCTDYDDLLKADEKSIQRKLEDYIMYLKTNYSANYLPTIFKPVELFYIMNKININTKLLHKMFPETTKKGGYGAYTREQLETMLKNSLKIRTKSLILFLASSGCRVGVIPELKLGHITNHENCKKILCYVGSKDEYIAFMTPEASKAFDEYLEERQKDGEQLDSESPAFRKKYAIGYAPAETMTVETIRSSIAMTMKNVQKTKSGNRFNIPTVHGFRKYFNIVFKSRNDANLSLCEKLMGHSVTISLDNAYAPFEVEQLFEEYKKVIPTLIISNEERLKMENEYKQKHIDELESQKDIDLKNLQDQIDSVRELLKRKNS